MNAPVSTVAQSSKGAVEIKLDRSTTRLTIRCVPGKHVYVSIHDNEHRQLAFAVASLGREPERFALDRKSETPYNDPALWIVCAAFDLTPAEADQVEQTFAECGLVVEKREGVMPADERLQAEAARDTERAIERTKAFDSILTQAFGSKR